MKVPCFGQKNASCRNYSKNAKLLLSSYCNKVQFDNSVKLIDLRLRSFLRAERQLIASLVLQKISLNLSLSDLRNLHLAFIGLFSHFTCDLKSYGTQDIGIQRYILAKIDFQIQLQVKKLVLEFINLCSKVGHFVL